MESFRYISSLLNGYGRMINNFVNTSMNAALVSIEGVLESCTPNINKTLTQVQGCTDATKLNESFVKA